MNRPQQHVELDGTKVLSLVDHEMVVGADFFIPQLAREPAMLALNQPQQQRQVLETHA